MFVRIQNEVIATANYTAVYELKIWLGRIISGGEKVQKTHLF
jgi:hypothetical protein